MAKLTVVERKILGTFIANSDNAGVVKMTGTELAQKMGYKAMGGIITYALASLEFKNHLRKVDKNTWWVLL